MVFMEALSCFFELANATCFKKIEMEAEKYILFFYRYLCAPLFSYFVPGHTSNPAGIVLAKARVSTISQPVASSKILPSVIMANMVDMIRVAIRKAPKHIEKSKPVGKVELAVNPDLKVAFPVVASSNIPDVYSLGSFNQSSKKTGLRAIVKKFFKSRLRDNILVSHVHTSYVNVIRNGLFVAGRFAYYTTHYKLLK